MNQNVWTKEQVNFRPFASGDADFLVGHLNNLDITKWLSRVPYPYTKHDAEEFLAKAQSSDLAVCLDDRVVGGVSTSEQFGFWFVPAVWNHGLASYVARQVVGQVFASKPNATLKSGYFLGNIASARVLAKTGFREVSCGLEHCLAIGEPVRHVNLEATLTDWRMVQ